MGTGRYIRLIKRFWWIWPVLIPLLFFFLLRPPGFDDPCSTVVEDRNGRLLGALIADDGQWRFPPPDSIPQRLKTCIILFEDKNFYHHPGVDAGALLRAVYLNLREGHIVSGGSTLSMQVIRLMRKGKERTYGEKLVEVLLALRLESMHSKDEILSMYLSNAPFGGNVVGLDAASWRYFGCHPSELTWADAATLAVLPNAPSLIHPGRNREQLEEKRNKLLDRLLQNGVMDTLTWSLSCQEPLPKQPRPLPQNAPHLLAALQAGHKGERLQTSLDSRLQIQAQALLDKHVKKLKENEIHNSAALILEVETGEVLAYVGNTSLGGGEHGEMVDVITAPRSSGRVLKPLLYAAMLEDGLILPGMLVPDIPTRMTGFSPKNFSGTYDGAVPASEALSRSLNVPAVNMLREYCVNRFHMFLQDMGMTTLTRSPGTYGLSLILGGAETCLWDLAGVYGGMSRTLNHFYGYSGRYDPTDIRPPEITCFEHKGAELQEDRRISASSIWLTYKAMEEVGRPEALANWDKFSSGRRIAWKTGTSFGFRDAWAVGTDPGYVVAVWAGNADGEGRPGLTGLNAAAPLMFELFDLLPPSDWFDQPFDEMTKVAVCRHSGYRAGPNCEFTDSIWVPIRGLNAPSCPFHTIVHLTPDEQYQVSDRCMDVNDMIHKKWFVLPPAMEWYYKSSHATYRELPPFLPLCDGSDERRSLSFIYPDWGSRIYVPVELDGTIGEAVLELAHRSPETTVFWHLDDHYIGKTTYHHQMGIHPERGEHLVTVVDEHGESAVVRFYVVSER